MTATLAVWWRLRRGGAREGRVPDVLAVLAFAVATAALLVTVGGVLAFRGLDAGDEQGVGSLYVTLALLAAGLMTVPVLTLGGTAARLAVARRDQRLAALRLAGATSGQVALMTLAEAAVQAVAGAALGAVLYAVLLPALGRLVFQGHALGASALWVGPALVAGVVAAVVVVAVLSGLAGLARVVVSPLGVAARTTPARLRAVRLLVAAVAVVGWLGVTQVMGRVGYGVLLLVLLGAVATVNVVGPWVVMLIGSVVASAARTPATLLAARRIVDDPRSTWRAVGAVALGVLVAGLSAVVAGAGGAGPDADGVERFLPADLATGSLVTLAVIAVVAATSTGVVQAARVLDQREQYRALALAGTEVATLHSARLREVAIPLAVAVGLAAGFVLLLLLPFSAAIGAALLARVLVAVALSVGLLLLAVVASRPLVTQVTRLG